ncbi:MAG: hypothetical protein II054_09360 [Treponema sp.]|nr:hypothetical protein [Treponema sp.]MBR6295168.1 hypothetical protein [Treponema sp.]
MENLNLVKSGLDISNILIEYLAKDALGSDFLKNYLTNIGEQTNAAKLQKEALEKLAESSSTIGKESRNISENAVNNNARLDSIFNAIEELQHSVRKIEADYRLYMEQFKELIQQAKEINSLVDSIKNISAQTNLLSFNASIEAARAGVAGKGFRIIANEVKKLSDDTDKTSETIKTKVENLTHSISTLEKDTLKNAEELTGLSEETGKTLEKFSNVRQINSENNDNVTHVTSRIEENIEDINKMIKSVKDADNVNRETLDNFARCASENEMLFNDLYSFAYQIKAIFKDLNSDQSKA